METRQDSDRLPVIAIVVPCYNEEAALPLSAPVLCGILDKMAGMSLISPDSYILCVDDGSFIRPTAVCAASLSPTTVAISTLCWPD